MESGNRLLARTRNVRERPASVAIVATRRDSRAIGVPTIVRARLSGLSVFGTDALFERRGAEQNEERGADNERADLEESRYPERPSATDGGVSPSVGRSSAISANMATTPKNHTAPTGGLTVA